MNTMLILRLILGAILFFAWMFLEYHPPAANDTDKIKSFIQSALMLLVGNTASQIGPT